MSPRSSMRPLPLPSLQKPACCRSFGRFRGQGHLAPPIQEVPRIECVHHVLGCMVGGPSLIPLLPPLLSQLTAILLSSPLSPTHSITTFQLSPCAPKQSPEMGKHTHAHAHTHTFLLCSGPCVAGGLCQGGAECYIPYLDVPHRGTLSFCSFS